VSAPVAEEIARYIDERELERPAVIGHSMGGSIGMMLAARHPDAVGRLMVVDMVPALGPLFGPPNATPEQIRAAADTFRTRILADTAGAPNGMLEQMFPGMTRVDSMRPRLMEGVRGTNRRTAANAFHELILADLRPELSRITVPVTVLYVVPPDAPMTPDQYDRVLRESFASAPGARIVHIGESAHFIMWDQPSRFLAEVDTLMRAGAGGAGGSQ
jgi:pimeloyl-ACP methyl ester carboxylesterase